MTDSFIVPPGFPSGQEQDQDADLQHGADPQDSSLHCAAAGRGPRPPDLPPPGLGPQDPGAMLGRGLVHHLLPVVPPTARLLAIPAGKGLASYMAQPIQALGAGNFLGAAGGEGGGGGFF